MSAPTCRSCGAPLMGGCCGQGTPVWRRDELVCAGCGEPVECCLACGTPLEGGGTDDLDGSAP